MNAMQQQKDNDTLCIYQHRTISGYIKSKSEGRGVCVARRHLCKEEEDDARVFRDGLVVQQSRAEGVGRDVCV